MQRLDKWNGLLWNPLYGDSIDSIKRRFLWIKTLPWTGTRLPPAPIIVSLGVGVRYWFSTTTGLQAEKVAPVFMRTHIRFHTLNRKKPVVTKAQKQQVPTRLGLWSFWLTTCARYAELFLQIEGKNNNQSGVVGDHALACDCCTCRGSLCSELAVARPVRLLHSPLQIEAPYPGR